MRARTPLALLAILGACTDTSCPSSCDDCAGVCLVAANIVPICTRTCTDSRGCVQGEVCAELSTLGGSFRSPGRICLPIEGPRVCPEVTSWTHCDPAFGSSCEGASVRVESSTFTSTPFCARLYQYCANGCVVVRPGPAGFAQCNPTP